MADDKTVCFGEKSKDAVIQELKEQLMRLHDVNAKLNQELDAAYAAKTIAEDRLKRCEYDRNILAAQVEIITMIFTGK